MKILTFTLSLLLASSLLAELPMLRATPYKFVQKAIGKGKPHFLEVGSESCHSCKIMGKQLYRIKQKNPAYNIEFVNVKREREAAFKLQIRMIPTQIIYDAKGDEVYRHIGLLSEKELDALFVKYNF